MTLSTLTNAIPNSWVEKLFERMAGLYGNKFLDMWGKTDLLQVKAIWAQELGKLTKDEIARGANSLINQDWCPTLPQFIKLCKPDIDSVAAYYEAINGVVTREHGEMGEWSHPAIFWASVRIGAFDLKNQSYSAIKNRWEKALSEEISKGQWPVIPAPQLSLSAPTIKFNKQIADKYISESQIIKNQESKTDHKLWAKKIMRRYKDGDKTLLHIQILKAQEALTNEVY